MSQSFTDQSSRRRPESLWRSGLRKFLLPLLSAALAGVTIASCTAFYTKEPVLYRKNVAVYRVPAADYPGGEIGDALTGVQPFPKLKASQLIDALGNLEYKRQSAWGETHARVFYDEELRLIAPSIAEAMANTGPEFRLIVVTRFDHDKSVLSRMERNSLVLWTDDAGLNVNFGEIREEIPNNDFRVDNDWTEVLPVSFARAYPDLELVPQDFFQLKQVGGYTHRTWAVIPVEDLAALRYSPPKPEQTDRDEAEAREANRRKQSDASKNSQTQTGESYFDEGFTSENTDRRDPTERLRKLKQALDEELITEEEYQTQRERILKDY